MIGMRTMHPDQFPERPSEKAKRRSLILGTVIAILGGWGILSVVLGGGTSDRTVDLESASRDSSFGDRGWHNLSDVQTCTRHVAQWGAKTINVTGGGPYDPTAVYAWFGPTSQEAYGIEQVVRGIFSSQAPGIAIERMREASISFCTAYLETSWRTGQMPALVAQDPCAYIPGDPACTENPMAQNLQACLAIPGRVLMEAPYCDPRLNYGE